MSNFEMAKQLIGDLPEQFEFIYAFGTIILFLIKVYVICLPVFVLGKIMGKN